MANEITVQGSLLIRKGNLQYRSTPTSFRATLTGNKGSSPGVITIPVAGVNIDFSKLTTLGLCWMINLDQTNYIRWGIHDGTLFHPIGRILPGEFYLFRLDHDLGEEEGATGTGTTAPINTFYMKAVGAPCVARIEAFEE